MYLACPNKSGMQNTKSDLFIFLETNLKDKLYINYDTVAINTAPTQNVLYVICQTIE